MFNAWIVSRNCFPLNVFIREFEDLYEIPASIFMASPVSLSRRWGWGEGTVLFLCSYKWRSGSFRSSKIISAFRLIRHTIPSKCATIRRDLAQKGREPSLWHTEL
jgi:hypothetical protein